MLAKPSLTLKRRLDAPPQTVYAAWTEPQQLMRWFGPPQAEMLSAQTDVRQGGRFRMVFRSPDGEEHDVRGVYREAVANEKLVMTWGWRTMPERESPLTITLKADGEGTILTLLHEQFFDEAARDQHSYGWSGALDKLERLFA
ncbi:MAG TPA: SRPBCC domain-containing protein [Pseudolabrys sp.]|nr:SRPBCC domain-containing protein [Pseudolabrys sp.]